MVMQNRKAEFLGIPSGNVVSIFAPAKLNLFLFVSHRFPDGYHRISSLMTMLDWGDDLLVRTRQGSGRIEIEYETACKVPPEQNTIYRAVREFLLAGRFALDVKIRLYKRIPAGSGLGGGSSDAAAAIRALCKIVGIDDPFKVLSPKEVAYKIGADVPFFLQAGHKLVGGIGERLQVLPLEWSKPLLLVVPNVEVSTADMYALLDQMRAGTKIDLTELESENIDQNRYLHIERFPEWAENDFLSVVNEDSGILQVIETLRVNGSVFAGMSGSGAAVFGFFDDLASLGRMANLLARDKRMKLVETVNLLHW